MSRHSGPHFQVAPEDQRCEAFVAGQPSYHWAWQRVGHRCPRRANQGRDGHLVCHIHAKTKKIAFAGPGGMEPENK